MTSVIDQNITEHALLREKPRERFNLLFRRLADDVLQDNCTLTRKFYRPKFKTDNVNSQTLLV